MKTQQVVAGAQSADLAVVGASMALELLSKDRIKKDQDQIRKNLLGLDASIHANAVQCLLHARTHGDTSLMRRLLVEIVDAKSGYRRQGIINWMRKHSPMELAGDTINLSGVIESEAQLTNMKKMFPDSDHSLFVVGGKRPFLVEEANKAPFTTDSGNAESVKPVYQAAALAPINRVHKDLLAAIENTANGAPIDVTKPFYKGLHADKVLDFATKVKEMADALPADATMEVEKTKQRIAQDSAWVEAQTKVA